MSSLRYSRTLLPRRSFRCRREISFASALPARWKTAGRQPSRRTSRSLPQGPSLPSFSTTPLTRQAPASARSSASRPAPPTARQGSSLQNRATPSNRSTRSTVPAPPRAASAPGKTGQRSPSRQSPARTVSSGWCGHPSFPETPKRIHLPSPLQKKTAGIQTQPERTGVLLPALSGCYPF